MFTAEWKILNKIIGRQNILIRKKFKIHKRNSVYLKINKAGAIDQLKINKINRFLRKTNRPISEMHTYKKGIRRTVTRSKILILKQFARRKHKHSTSKFLLIMSNYDKRGVLGIKIKKKTMLCVH